MKLICNFIIGYPSMLKSISVAQYSVAGGCEILQASFPARDPFLENDFIAYRMATALSQNDHYDDYMDIINEITHYMPHIRIVISIYESTLKEIGIEKFVKFCTEHRIQDVTLIGSDDDNTKQQLMEAGLKISGSVNFSDEEKMVSSSFNGFINIQMDRQNKTTSLKERIDNIHKQAAGREIFCTSVTTAEDCKKALEAGADGAFIDDDVLRLSDKPERFLDTIEQIKKAVTS